jgi:hypothetical protein
MQIMVIGCCLELGQIIIKQFLERALHVINGIECRLSIKKVNKRVTFFKAFSFYAKVINKVPFITEDFSRRNLKTSNDLTSDALWDKLQIFNLRSIIYNKTGSGG